MFSDILNIVKITFEKGAEYTKEIVARMGRAGTVGERSVGYRRCTCAWSYLYGDCG